MAFGCGRFLPIPLHRAGALIRCMSHSKADSFLYMAYRFLKIVSLFFCNDGSSWQFRLSCFGMCLSSCIETFILQRSSNSSSKCVKFTFHIPWFSLLCLLLTIMTKTGQMDAANRAMCYALRNPGKDGKPMKLKSIQKLVAHQFFKPRICDGMPWAGVMWGPYLNFGKSDSRFGFLDSRFLIMIFDGWVASAGS